MGKNMKRQDDNESSEDTIEQHNKSHPFHVRFTGKDVVVAPQNYAFN